MKFLFHAQDLICLSMTGYLRNDPQLAAWSIISVQWRKSTNYRLFTFGTSSVTTKFIDENQKWLFAMNIS